MSPNLRSVAAKLIEQYFFFFEMVEDFGKREGGSRDEIRYTMKVKSGVYGRSSLNNQWDSYNKYIGSVYHLIIEEHRQRTSIHVTCL